MDETTKNWHIKVLIYAAYIIIGYYIVREWLPALIVLLMPFILAYFVALITQPLERFLEKKLKFPRKVAALSAWAVALVIFCSIVGFLIMRLIIGLVDFANNTPVYMQKLTDLATYWSGLFTIWQDKLPAGINLYFEIAIASVTTQLTGMVTSFSRVVASWAANAGMVLLGGVVFWLFFIVASFFMCKDFSFIKRSIMIQFPISTRGKISQIKNFTTDAIVKYFRAMVIVLGIVFLTAWIGLIILHVKYALWIALLLAVLDILPLLGTSFVLIPWGLIAIFAHGNIPLGIGLLVLFAIIIIIRHLVEPKVVSSSMGLYPIVTLMAIYVGLKTFGFAGAILFPIAALVLVYLQRAGVLTFWKSQQT